MANDLILKPDYVFDENPQYKTLISQFENGAEQRRAKRSSAITEYKLVYKNRTATDLGTITTLFNSKKGTLTSFTWTHPISASTLTVRFKEDSLTYSNTSYGLYDFEFNLVSIL
jgi:phage-related protein